jgi:hypothetical protein
MNGLLGASEPPPQKPKSRVKRKQRKKTRPLSYPPSRILSFQTGRVYQPNDFLYFVSIKGSFIFNKAFLFIMPNNYLLQRKLHFIMYACLAHSAHSYISIGMMYHPELSSLSHRNAALRLGFPTRAIMPPGPRTKRYQTARISFSTTLCAQSGQDHAYEPVVVQQEASELIRILSPQSSWKGEHQKGDIRLASTAGIYNREKQFSY